MKKVTLFLGMALMAAMLIVVTPASAQSREVKKQAKKEARKLEKGGYKTMGLPLVSQLEKFYAYLNETGDDGTPKYMSATELATGNSYSAAKMQAINVAKVRLAEQVQTTVMSQAKTDLANSSLSAEDAASLTKALEKSTGFVAQKLSRVIVAEEYYRVLDNKNYEVVVALICDSKAIREQILEDARAELRKEMADFNPEFEKILGSATCTK